MAVAVVATVLLAGCDGRTDWLADGRGSGEAAGPPTGQSAPSVDDLGGATPPVEPARAPAAAFVAVHVINAERWPGRAHVRLWIRQTVVHETTIALDPRGRPNDAVVIGPDEADRVEVNGEILVPSEVARDSNEFTTSVTPVDRTPPPSLSISSREISVSNQADDGVLAVVPSARHVYRLGTDFRDGDLIVCPLAAASRPPATQPSRR